MSILGSFPLTARPYAYSVDTGNPLAAYVAGHSFFEYAGKTIYFDLNSENDYRLAYLQCPPLKAVINRRAQMFCNGKTSILNNNTENKQRGQYAKDIQTLLDRPNILQSQAQFKAQQNIYIDLFGYCPVLKITPIGMPKSVKAMWNLPPWLFEIEYTGNWTEQTELKGIYKQFYLNWGGVKKPLPMDGSVFLILDSSISTYNDGRLLRPDSRVKSLEYPISNVTATNQAANTLTAKKGAIGILSNDAGSGQYAPLKVGSEKEKIQQDFRRYGMTGQEFQVIITDASLKWQSMSYPVKDMMLFEIMNAALGDICDGMGMYAYLMTSKLGAGATFANLNEAKKSQYQDFIIPDDQARTQQLSDNLLDPSENCYLDVDYSHVEVLQESEQAKAVTLAAQGAAYQAQFDLGIVTRNDIRDSLGMPKITGVPEMDEYSFQSTTPPEPPARFPSQAEPV